MTSLGLAELYINFGIEDILLTSEIYGANKIRRLCNYSKHGEITVGVDNIDNVRQISNIARANNTKVNVALELYMGQGSAGVKNWEEEALPLAKIIDDYSGVDLRGVWWHEGSLSRITDWQERKEAHFKTLDNVATLVSEMEDAGINVDLVSGGFTCTWNITPLYKDLSGVGVQAGNYVLMDWVDKLLPGLEDFTCALTVLTRCISRPSGKEAVFDSGMNTCSDEAGGSGGDKIEGGYTSIVGPRFKHLRGVNYPVHLREEISWVTFPEPNHEVEVGETFEFIPPHGDTTAKLHDKYYGIRDGKVEVIWPKYGRGLF
ncbi:MAG: alanine racemase [Candidatus Bathyarchaeia archaeon]